MKRHALALLCLAVLVALAGCSLFDSGGEVDEEELLGNATYQWEDNATATYNLSVSSDSFTTVMEMNNRSSLELSRETTIRGDQSISVSALRFRFPNGTIVNATHPKLRVTEQSDETNITLPARNGTLAFTTGRNGKSWSLPVFVEGSHKVILPEDTRVTIPLLSRVSPSPDERGMENNRVYVYWEDQDSGSLSVRYYLVRDLYIFGSIAAVAILLGIGGTVYYFREIRQAQKKREEVGLDVESEPDEFDNDEPPPGM